MSPLSFPTRSLGWLVNQRNPSGYWQLTKGDLSQIISSLHYSFLLRSSFFISFNSVWLRALISDRFFYSEFASFYRAQLEFSFFFSYRKHLDDGRLNRVNSGGEIAIISSSSIDDSLSAWIGLLDGTRIRTLVNLLYLGISDNHWN